MGTWSLPETKKLAKQLAALMATPLEAETSRKAIYHLIGDDHLYDDIDDLEYIQGPKSDVRPLIAARLKIFLDDYAEHPETFNYVWEPAALKICHKIVEQYFSSRYI